jgi:fructosamine-3-kinase
MMINVRLINQYLEPLAIFIRSFRSHDPLPLGWIWRSKFHAIYTVSIQLLFIERHNRKPTGRGVG